MQRKISLPSFSGVKKNALSQSKEGVLEKKKEHHAMGLKIRKGVDIARNWKSWDGSRSSKLDGYCPILNRPKKKGVCAKTKEG